MCAVQTVLVRGLNEASEGDIFTAVANERTSQVNGRLRLSVRVEQNHARGVAAIQSRRIRAAHHDKLLGGERWHGRYVSSAS